MIHSLTENQIDEPSRDEQITQPMRVEDMFGLLGEAIDYEFLEIVLGCRGRKVPEDVQL